MTTTVHPLVHVRWPHKRLAAIGVVLACLTAAGPVLHLAYGGWALMLIFAVGGTGAYLASQIVSTDQRGALIVILVGAVAMRFALLFVEPYLSTDIYCYIWDGRVQAAGINPYRYVPSAPEVAHLRDVSIYPNINRAGYAVTIYPPTTQAIFLAITRLGESVLAMKLGLIAFEAATVAVRFLSAKASQPRASPPTPGTRCPSGRSPAAATWMRLCARYCWWAYCSSCMGTRCSRAQLSHSAHWSSRLRCWPCRSSGGHGTGVCR
jgi:hypothetical protein